MVYIVLDVFMIDFDPFLVEDALVPSDEAKYFGVVSQ